jgi:beta-1,4-N-acetylglucosaminyltransferase
MILVTVGASQFPFDRLLRACDAVVGDERVVVQHGCSTVRPSGAECIRFVALDELATLVREARVVVTHGGVGSVLLALSNGKRPVVVPRMRAFGETVDDHQVESARRFAAAGLVTLVEDPADLPTAIAESEPTIAPPGNDLRLVRDLRDYIGAAVAPEAARR